MTIAYVHNLTLESAPACYTLPVSASEQPQKGALVHWPAANLDFNVLALDCHCHTLRDSNWSTANTALLGNDRQGTARSAMGHSKSPLGQHLPLIDVERQQKGKVCSVIDIGILYVLAL